jgi:hypothetical protein
MLIISFTGFNWRYLYDGYWLMVMHLFCLFCFARVGVWSLILMSLTAVTKAMQ